MKFHSTFHKNIIIIAMSMMSGMLLIGMGSMIYYAHYQGETLSFNQMLSLFSLERIEEATAFMESIIGF